MTDARRSILRWAVVAAIVLQLVIPAIALTGPRPTRFGWQMFTAMAPIPTILVETDDGGQRRVDVESMLAHPRSEADLVPALVEALCRDPATRAVIVEDRSGTRERVGC